MGLTSFNDLDKVFVKGGGIPREAGGYPSDHGVVLTQLVLQVARLGCLFDAGGGSCRAHLLHDLPCT